MNRIELLEQLNHYKSGYKVNIQYCLVRECGVCVVRDLKGKYLLHFYNHVPEPLEPHRSNLFDVEYLDSNLVLQRKSGMNYAFILQKLREIKNQGEF